MNDAYISNKFKFLTLKFRKFKYTDSYSVDIHEGDFFYVPEGLSYQSYRYDEPIGILFVRHSRR